MNDRIKLILDEQRFPYEGMDLEERDFCINILNNCKDICESDNLVGNSSHCEIVEMQFKKLGNRINGNGSLAIGDDKVKEYRCIDADIYIENSSILVDMLITRLCSDAENKKYRVLDEFKVENGVLKRTSQYNYDMKNIFTEINDPSMKGKLK